MEQLCQILENLAKAARVQISGILRQQMRSVGLSVYLVPTLPSIVLLCSN